MSKLLIVLSMLLFSSIAFAGGGTCSGKSGGSTIIIRGMSLSLSNLRQGNGVVEVNGREVARFEMRNASISMVFKTIKARNNHGDILDAKVTSMTRYTAVIQRFYSRGYGIDLRNIAVKCY